MTLTRKNLQISQRAWQEANRTFLHTHLKRLRMLLQRRVLWLRRQWQHDPLQTYQGMVISDAQADWLLAGEDPRAEARFYEEDPQAARISQTISAMEQNLAKQTHASMGAASPPALEVLVQLFGLTAFERNVLLLCLAPELDPTFERLYAYVQDDVNRKYATPHLALALFGGYCSFHSKEDGGEAPLLAHDSFLPNAPLFRFQLVSLEAGPMSATIPGARPLCLDQRVGDYLQGINRPDDRVTYMLDPIAPALPVTSHRDLLERLARAYASCTSQGRWPVVNLTGPTGVGKRSIARMLCDRLGLQLYSLDVGRLPAPGPDQQKMLHLLEREAVLMQTAYYLDTDNRDDAHKQTADSLADVIKRLGAFLIVGSRQRWQSERKILSVRVAKPDATEQRLLWQQALAGTAHSLNGRLENMVQQFDFGPQTISAVVKAAEGHARLRVNGEKVILGPDDLWQACREQAGWHLDDLAQRIIPCYTWEDIVLPPDVLQQLQEIAAQVAHRHRVYETWGFGTKLSRGRGTSALFAGPSGTGKTMAAEILAHHLELDLYRIDLAGVVSKYIGETEKNLKKVFDAAEQSGAILFFDEADALFGKRTEVKDSHDRYANIEVNYLLQRMEDYRGLAILATNRKSALDRAFLRRLRFLVDFPFPDAASRCRIWQKVFPRQAEVAGLDCESLARLEIAGGNIKNIAINAAFLAASAGASIGMAQVMHSARREYAKIDKLTTASEFGLYYRVAEA